MSTTENPGGESRSRFSYHGDEPEEGGVTSVQPKTARQGSGGRPSVNGVPGPEERLLDITELVNNIGMRYTHGFRLPPSEIPEVTAVAPTVGTLTLTNSGALLLLKGNAKTTLQMECYRCLTPTEEPVEVELDEAFPLVTTNNAYRQAEIQAVDEDAPTAVIKGNVLDLGDLLRQELTVSAPLQPLCREDCPGLLKPEEIEPEPTEEEPAETRRPFEGLGELLKARQGETDA